MWYKIVQNDTEGYIYRAFTANDDFGYMYSTYYLILEDGTQMEVKIHGDCVHNYVVDHLSQYNYFTTYYGWESPPYGYYYNMNTGETFSTVGYPDANSDGSYFVAYNNGYYEVYSELGIYSMNDQSIETVFFKDFGRWELSAPQWLSTTKLQLRAVSADTKVEKKLIIELQDGSWQSSLK